MKSTAAQIAGLVFGMLVVMIILHPESFESLWWQTYSDPNGNFSLKFPSKPTISDQQGKLGDGGTVVRHMVAANPDKTTSYGFMDYYDPRFASKTVDEVLNLARDEAISRVHGALLDEQYIQIDGHQARDVQVRAGEDSGLSIRLIADGQRLVLLVVANAGQSVDSKRVQKFFNSLRLSN